MEPVRSRHDRAYNSELVRLSREFQKQREAGRESYCDLQKMIREVRYFQQLNDKLTQEVSMGRRKIKMAESNRQRHRRDLQHLEHLRQLRQQQQDNNYQAALRVRREREVKARAVEQNWQARASVGEASRCQSRQHRDSIQQDRFQQYLRKKERVEEGIAFHRQARERAVRRHQIEDAQHIQRLRTSILLQKKEARLRDASSMELKTRLRALTEQSESKVRVLEDMGGYLQKLQSAYCSGVRGGKRTEECSSREQSTLLLSQPSQE